MLEYVSLQCTFSQTLMLIPGSLPAYSLGSILLYAYWLPLLGVMGALAVRCGLRKAEEQEMRYLSCRELRCKLSTAVWDLAEKTLHPCNTSSPQTPPKPCPHLWPFLFLPLQIKHFCTPYPVTTPTPRKLPFCCIVHVRPHIFS